jgi:hypothetical protein
MKPDTADPLAAWLALNSAPFVPPDSLWPGQPFLDQMQFIATPPIPDGWFEDVAALLGVPSPREAQITIEDEEEGPTPIGLPEDPTFRRYNALCTALYGIHELAFFQLSRSLHQNTERRHRMAGRFQQIQAASKRLLDLLGGAVETTEWDLPIASRLLTEPLELGQRGDLSESELEQLKRLLEVVHRKAAALEQQYQKGPGRTKDDTLQALLRSLEIVYKHFTGKSPTRVRNSYKERPGGKFLELVEKMYALVGPPYSEKTDDAIDKAIHRYVLSKPRKTGRTSK